LRVCGRHPEAIASRRLYLAFATVGVHDPERDRTESPPEGHAVTGATGSVDIRDAHVRDLGLRVDEDMRRCSRSDRVEVTTRSSERTNKAPAVAKGSPDGRE
jgi:hypothetical protein